MHPNAKETVNLSPCKKCKLKQQLKKKTPETCKSPSSDALTKFF